MKRRRWCPSRCEAALAAALVTLGCQSAPSAGSSSTTATAAAVKPAPSLSLAFVEVTTGGAARDAKLPLIVALHGLGGRPEHFLSLFEGFPVQARIVAPHSSVAYGDGFQWFAPYGATSDESAPGMAKAADDVAQFAGEAARARPTLGKPIVTGFSQGGALSYAVAARHPDAIAESVPISGWLPPPLWPASSPDHAPPSSRSTAMPTSGCRSNAIRAGADALRKLGFKVELRVSAGVEHAVPRPVRELVVAALAEACDEQRHAGGP